MGLWSAATGVVAAGVFVAGGWAAGLTGMTLLAAGCVVFAGVYKVENWREYEDKVYAMDKNAEVTIARDREEAITRAIIEQKEDEEETARKKLYEEAETEREKLTLKAKLDAQDAAQAQALAVLSVEVKEDNSSMDHFDERTQYLLEQAEAAGLPFSDVKKIANDREKERLKYEKMLNDTYAYIDDGIDATTALIKATSDKAGKITGTSPIISAKKRGPLPKLDIYATTPLPEVAIDGEVKLKKNPLA